MLIIGYEKDAFLWEYPNLDGVVPENINFITMDGISFRAPLPPLFNLRATVCKSETWIFLSIATMIASYNITNGGTIITT